MRKSQLSELRTSCTGIETSPCISINRPTPAIDPEILRTMIVRHFIRYAPNPGTRKRNQVF